MALSAAKGLKVCSQAYIGGSKILVSATSVQVTQTATLKHTFGEKYPYLKPFPYWKRDIWKIECMWENTLHRICEQSKIITVEGNVGSGKHLFAKRLAKEFDLKYVPGLTNEDLWLIPHNGFNMKDLNEAFYDTDNKMMDMKDLFNMSTVNQGRIARLQAECMRKRYFQYFKCLLHLLSTGQGIVTVRSPFTEEVFGNALKQLGWITPQYNTWHTRTKSEELKKLVNRPHLNVYLDAPVDVCLKNIDEKAKKNPNYPVGPHLNRDFLQAIEDNYKPWLDKNREDHEVVVLDWAEAAEESELDVIWEAIAELPLQPQDWEELRFRDWRLTDEEAATGMRYYLSNLRPTNVYALMYDELAYDAPEFLGHHETREEKFEVFMQHPRLKYRDHYDTQGFWNSVLLGPLGKHLNKKGNF